MSTSKIRTLLEMIKFEHSVFALPFALTAALLAARFHASGALVASSVTEASAWPTARQIFWIIVAMVGARSAAMTMNRIADLHYDRLNPRTQQRALVTGALSVQFAWGFTLLSSAALVVAAWQLNPLALKLSPVALAVVFFYSYTKRFTTWSHLVLCFCLGMSPAALWVAGFDVLYACQDIEFDKQVGLYSIPKKFGVAGALAIARAMHVLMVALLGWLAWSFHLPWPAWAGIVVVALLLAYEHSLLKPTDLSRINAAFFTVNGYISLLFLLFWGAAVAVSQR